jgi:heme-binding NEAT domain protein
LGAIFRLFLKKKQDNQRKKKRIKLEQHMRIKMIKKKKKGSKNTCKVVKKNVNKDSTEIIKKRFSKKNLDHVKELLKIELNR